MTGAFGNVDEGALYVGGGGCKTRNRSSGGFVSSYGTILAGRVMGTRVIVAAKHTMAQVMAP
jgi:hypothetical protein